MRAKNEAKFLAEAYNTVNERIILERVVDGTLMCPEACCGAPVMECKCGPDCEHCNCHEIQKLAKKDNTIKEFYKMRDPEGDGSWPDDDDDQSDHPDWGEPEHGDRGTGEIGREDEERVRLTLDSPGTASVHLPKGDPRIQKYLDKGYKIVKGYKKAEQEEDNEKRDKNREFADSLWSKDPEDLARRRRAAERVLGKRRNPRPAHLFTKEGSWRANEDNEGHPRQGMTQYEHKPDPMIKAHREEMARLKKIDLSKWRDHIENNPKTGVDDIMKKVHKQYPKASLPSKYSKDYDIVWDKKVRPFLMHEFPDN